MSERWRWLLGSVALMTVSIWWLQAIEADADRLLRDGEEVQGTVTERWTGTRGSGRDVQFSYRGEERSARIATREPEPDVAEGDHVTVVVDPSDPDEVRTTLHSNVDSWRRALGVGGVVASTMGLLIALVHWWPRRRSRERVRLPGQGGHGSDGLTDRVLHRVRRDFGAGLDVRDLYVAAGLADRGWREVLDRELGPLSPSRRRT